MHPIHFSTEKYSKDTPKPQSLSQLPNLLIKNKINAPSFVTDKAHGFVFDVDRAKFHTHALQISGTKKISTDDKALNFNGISLKNPGLNLISKKDAQFKNLVQSKTLTGINLDERSETQQEKTREIGLTTEELLRKKQATIENLKLELQEAKYSIKTLKEMNKQLLEQNQKRELNKRNLIDKMINQCPQCRRLESVLLQLNLLKGESLVNNELISIQKHLIQKLSLGLPKPNQQTPLFLFNKVNQNTPQQQITNSTQQNALILNKSDSQSSNQFNNKFTNKVETIYNQSITKKSMKQNHPSTPKNARLFGLCKKDQNQNKENENKCHEQTMNSNSFQQNEKKNHHKVALSSPFRLKQKVMKNLHSSKQSSQSFDNKLQNSFQDLGIFNCRLDRKIYF